MPPPLPLRVWLALTAMAAALACGALPRRSTCGPQGPDAHFFSRAFDGGCEQVCGNTQCTAIQVENSSAWEVLCRNEVHVCVG
jgi:hypothetical protein